MITFVEGNLRIPFPRDTEARRFDCPESHGLSHCMKIVDFIVEESDHESFIELKNLEHTRARETNRKAFISEFISGKSDRYMKYKYRDTFLYEWASRSFKKPILYWVIVAIETLTPAELSRRTDALRRKLPNGQPSAAWNRPIASNCVMFNIETWNRQLPYFPLSRIP